MKKEISKSRGKNGVKRKLVLKKKFVLIFFSLILLIFIILGILKYFNNKIENNNRNLLQEYVNNDKQVCFKEECFYVLDYSIQEKFVYLMLEKNISISDESIKKNNIDGLKRDDVNKYLEVYKNRLEDLGVEVLDITIPTDKQLEMNGCSFKNNSSNIYTCSDNKKWIYSTSYYYDGDISGVMVNIKKLNTHFIFPFDMTNKELDDIYGEDSTLNIGVRPVIKVPISEID